MSVAYKQVTLNLVVDALRVNKKWSEVKAGEELTTLVQDATSVYDCVSLGCSDDVKSTVKAVLVLLNHETGSNCGKPIKGSVWIYPNRCTAV